MNAIKIIHIQAQGLVISGIMRKNINKWLKSANRFMDFFFDLFFGELEVFRVTIEPKSRLYLNIYSLLCIISNIHIHQDYFVAI